MKYLLCVLSAVVLAVMIKKDIHTDKQTDALALPGPENGCIGRGTADRHMIKGLDTCH